MHSKRGRTQVCPGTNPHGEGNALSEKKTKNNEPERTVERKKIRTAKGEVERGRKGAFV